MNFNNPDDFRKSCKLSKSGAKYVFVFNLHKAAYSVPMKYPRRHTLHTMFHYGFFWGIPEDGCNSGTATDDVWFTSGQAKTAPNKTQPGLCLPDA